MAGSFHPPSESGLGRLAATKEVVQIADLRALERYVNRDPFVVAAVELAGIRTLLAVPDLSPIASNSRPVNWKRSRRNSSH